jgi:uncharacterized protein (TIGR02001 family)
MRLIVKNFSLTSAMIISVLICNSAYAELKKSVAVTSNYVFRGISQTDDNAALQGSVDYSIAAGTYMGIWASTVDKGLEYDLFLGQAGKAGIINYNFGLISHEYTDKDFFDGSIRELYLGLNYKVITFRFFDGFDTRAPRTDHSYYDLSLDIPLPAETKLNLHYGVFEPDTSGIDNDEDYSIGIKGDVAGFGVSATYAEFSSNTKPDDEIFYISVSKTLAQ